MVVEKNHIAEVVKVDGLDIIAESERKSAVPVGTLLETAKLNKIIFIVLDDLYAPLTPDLSLRAYGIEEDKLGESYPYIDRFMRYFLRIYPLAEYGGEEQFSVVSKSPFLNALLYEVPWERVVAFFENFEVIDELGRIDKTKFPKRNKAIINAIKTYISGVEESDLPNKKRYIVEKLSVIFKGDYTSLMEIVRGISK